MSSEPTTERLVCRRPTGDDLGWYSSLLRDPEVERWLRPAPLRPFSDSEVAERLRGDLDQWDEYGWGPWVLERRDGGAFAGRGGLCWTEVEGGRAIELASSVPSTQQGQGIATEAGRAALALAADLEIHEVVWFTTTTNLASQSVMRKLGFTGFREIGHAGLPHVIGRTSPARTSD